MALTDFCLPVISRAGQALVNKNIAMHFCVTGTPFRSIENPFLLKVSCFC
ncbi:hypothetical protein PC116_g8955 [Phytophthora cactorum]|nr:hypothetical protein PC116_g8955 [Phytophthora cactorum]